MEPCSSSRITRGRWSSIPSSCALLGAAARGRARRRGAGQRPHDRRSRPPVRRLRPAGRGTAWLRAPRRERRSCTSRPSRVEQLADVRAGPAAPGRAPSGPAARRQGRGPGAAFPARRAQLEHELRAEVALLAAPLVPHFALLDGHAVIEVKPAAHTKDSAVTAFMEEAPFRGRHADLHRRRPDRLRRLRGGAALRRPGDRGRPARQGRNGGCPDPPRCASGSGELATR